MFLCGCGVRSFSREEFSVFNINGKDTVVCTSRSKAWFGYLMSISDTAEMYGKVDKDGMEIQGINIHYRTDPNSIDAAKPIIVPVM